jgi:hypothetical protein
LNLLVRLYLLGIPGFHAVARNVLLALAMNNLMLNLSGPELSRLRVLVEAVGEEVGRLTAGAVPGESAPPKNALDLAWSRLVGLLDLGSEPEMQTCPNCKAQCMRRATLCGNCWTRIPAPNSKPTASATT